MRLVPAPLHAPLVAVEGAGRPSVVEVAEVASQLAEVRVWHHAVAVAAIVHPILGSEQRGGLVTDASPVVVWLPSRCKVGRAGGNRRGRLEWVDAQRAGGGKMAGAPR